MIHLLYPDENFDFSIFNTNYQHVWPNDIRLDYTLEWILNYTGLAFTRSTAVNQQVNHFIPINLLTPPAGDEFSQFFDSFPSSFVNLFDKNNVKFLFYQPTECNTFYMNFNDQFSVIKKYMQKWNVSPDRIFFVTGDLGIENTQKTVDDQFYQNINASCLEVWEILYYNRIQGKELSKIVYHADKYRTQPKKYKFLCLNSNVRQHKQVLLYHLHIMQQMDCAAISCLWNIHKDIATEDEFFSNSIDYDYRKFVEFIRNFSRSLDDWKNMDSPLDYYYASKFSIVTETFAKDSVINITEKIYKCFAIGHPFLLWGGSHTLHHLRQKGYETFDELFDESYDTISVAHQRLPVMLGNLQQDIDITDHTLDKIAHNRAQFLSQKSRQYIGEHLLELLS